MSGNVSALNGMLENMRHGGGFWHTCAEHMHRLEQVVFNGITIKGIYGRQMFETWYKMTSMIQTGLDISPVITHHFKYTDFEKGFELMRTGQCGKVILEWV